MTRPKRKAIPKKVRLTVLARTLNCCAACGHGFRRDSKIEFDHRPAIIMRAVNVEGTDYHPPQNDPAHIEPLHKSCHLQRTVGRKADAERTVTVKGSDAWLKSKFARLEGKTKKRPTKKIANRGFQKKENRKW